MAGPADLISVLKVNRLMEVAFENDLPLISLVQSVSAICRRSGIVPNKPGGRIPAAAVPRLPQGRPALP
jgi:hypothetical protein